jgi:hypothetical protein
MTAPTADGQPSLPKRAGPKGLLPSTWLERTLKIAYTDLLWEWSGDQWDVARLLPGRADPERRRRQDDDFVGSARALRAGRGLEKSSMVINRTDWRLHGDLLEWIATEYPGLSRAQFEAAYRLLANPNITDEAAEQVEVMLRGCSEAAKERRHE